MNPVNWIIGGGLFLTVLFIYVWFLPQIADWILSTFYPVVN